MKRNLIIVTFFLFAFFTLCATGCEAECVETRFDCNNDIGCAAFLPDQKGIKCTGDCIDCEWYPLFCGVGELDYCMSPIICGFDLCSGAPIDSSPMKSRMPSHSTDLPIKQKTIEIVEDEDYTISDIAYVLADSRGNVARASTFEDLLRSDLYQSIEDEDYWDIMGDLMDGQTFSITVEITLQTRCEMSVNASCIYSTTAQGLITNRDKYETSRTLQKGEHTLSIKIKDLDYADTLFDMSIKDISVYGTKTVYSLGEVQ